MYAGERDRLLAVETVPRRMEVRRERVFVAGVAAGASLPVIVATIRSLVAGWMPLGDQGIIATRAYDVFTTHTPLLGQYSEASTVTGQPTYSPGPLLYWILALPARFGAPASLTLTIALLNVACIGAVVVLAHRRGGRPLALLTGIAIALVCLSLSAESLHDIFNPSAALFPFLLLVFLCWSLACGDLRLLPLTVLVASLVVQCQLGYVPPTGALLAVAVVGLALTRRRVRGHDDPPRRLRGVLVVAGLVALLCWTVPAIQELTHHPGNLTVLARETTTHQRTEGATRAGRVLVQTIGVPPRWLRTPTAHGGRYSDTAGGDYGDTRLQDLSASPSALQRVTAVVVLAALVVLALVARRRRRGDLVAALALALALCAALGVEVEVTPAKATNTLGYMLWWSSIAGMWVWLALAWSAASLAADARRVALRLPAAGSAAALAVVAGSGVAVVVAMKADAHEPYYRPTRLLAAKLDAALTPGMSVRLVQRGGPMVAIEPTIRYTLRRHGVRALGPYASRRPGAWYELDHRRYAYIVSVNADRPPRFRPARVVARTTMVDARGRQVLTATLSPPSAQEELSPRKNAQTARAADIPGAPNPPGHS
jgi:hypothetical protein